MSAGERVVDAGRGAVSWGLKGLLGLVLGAAAVSAIGGGILAVAASAPFWGVALAMGLSAAAAGTVTGLLYGGPMLTYSAVAGGIKGAFTSRADESNSSPELQQQMALEQQRALMLQDQMMRRQEMAEASQRCADPDVQGKGGNAARLQQAANTINNNINAPQPGVPSV